MKKNEIIYKVFEELPLEHSCIDSQADELKQIRKKNRFLIEKMTEFSIPKELMMKLEGISSEREAYYIKASYKNGFRDAITMLNKLDTIK